MPIAIVVEDGSNVTNANSFASIAEARSYALERGVTLSLIDDEVAVLLIKAKDYLESFANRYQGTLANQSQALQWPRIDVYLYASDLPFASNAIPKELKYAQCSAVLAIFNGIDIMPSYSTIDSIVEEKIGPISTKYANHADMDIKPILSSVDSLLRPLFNYNKFALITKRA